MGKKLVVDSSVLIILSRMGALEAYLTRRKGEGYEVLVPRAIVRELLVEPKRYAEGIKVKYPELASKIMQSVGRVNGAIQQGLIGVETVNYREYSKIMDNVRKRLSRLDAKPEHAVKKGDPELIILVIQLYDKFKEKIFVSTKDKSLIKILKLFSRRVEYGILNGP